MEKKLGRGMVELIRVHGLDEAKVISHLVQVRDGVGHPDAIFTMLGEFVR